MLKDSLYKALTSQINYVNYIETLTPTVEGKTDFELLQTIYIGFLYTILFDDYFDVKNKRVSSLLSDSYTEKLINKIAKKTKTGYTFGEVGVNLEYSSKELALYKLRNKIAHGDFYIEDGNIVFEENNSKAVIKLDDFTSMVATLEYSGNKNKKYEQNTKLLYINKCSSRKNVDFNKVHQVIIKDKPVLPRIRDDRYVSNMERIIEEISSFIGSNKDLPIKAYKYKINECIPIWKKENGIDIECSIVSVTSLPKYKEMKERLLNKKEELISKGCSITAATEIDIFSKIVYDFENESRIAIRKSLLANVIMLQYLSKHPTASRDEIIENIDPRISKIILLGTDNIIVISYLVGFYAIFQYGLETLMTKCNERRMYDIYDKSNLNFAELDVDILDTNNRVNGIDAPKLDYSKEKSSRLISSECKYHGLLRGYNDLISKMGSIPESANSLINKLGEAYNEYKSTQHEMFEDFCKYTDFLAKFDFNRYTNNLDIVYHVRNAIAHGNIKIEKYGKELNDTAIHITDRSEGRVGNIVYDKIITIDEFNKIFSGMNIDILHNFLAEHTDNDEEVDKDFLEKVYKRIEER